MSIINMIDITANDTPKFWQLVQDKDATYLRREDIYQRLRFSPDFPLDIQKMNDEIIKSNYKGITNLHLNTRSLVVNNAKNLNPCVVKPNNNTTDVDLIILTIGGGFKLLNYKLEDKVSIRCTFKNDNLCGAIIAYDSKKTGDIIHLAVSKGNKIYDVVYKIERGNKLRYSMFRRPENSKFAPSKTVREFMFAMDIPVSEAFITTDKHEEHVRQFIRDSKMVKKKVVVIKDGDYNSLEAQQQIKELYNNGYRAITQYGILLPYEILKENKFQYVFILDKTNKIKTIRSN